MSTSSNPGGVADTPRVPATKDDPITVQDSGDDSGATAARNRKVQFRFDALMDEHLAKEVLAHNPYEADFGAIGPTWERVADALGVACAAPRHAVDGRRCRERIKLLVKGRRRRVAELEKASGIEETVSDLDAMLDEIIMIQESSIASQAERRQTEKENAERADRIAEEIRQKAIEGMRPREKRRAPSEDSTLISLLEARQATESARQTSEAEIKRQKLVLEERRLELEERRIELAERRAALEAQERLAIINLLVSLSSKTAPPET
ncbi:hypothetical protein P43SY_010241 [Pythium insidiosum]|uniref:Myb-like domain-containing protein n=1 Tax=Pythium insidiosum TaxID=114742 RepID=A0AAD5L616_PYTIN|nr:hypothetical protein P43SY_010241 [Pythium insidiosum]